MMFGQPHNMRSSFAAIDSQRVEQDNPRDARANRRRPLAGAGKGLHGLDRFGRQVAYLGVPFAGRVRVRVGGNADISGIQFNLPG